MPQRPLVLAHRGARRDAPENTLEAFAVARTQGADGVELDVRRTRDGALVVHHDPEPEGGPVLASVDLVEVRRGFPGIPTLGEALDVCAGLVVNVEIKNHPKEPDFDPDDRVADRLVALLAERGGIDRVLVSSFHLPTIDRVRTVAPHIPTGFLFKGAVRFDRLATLVADRGHRALHPNVWALAGGRVATCVRAASDRGLEVNVWTVNKPADIVRLAAAGVDGLVTDVPDVAVATLAQTGSTTDSASGT